MQGRVKVMLVQCRTYYLLKGLAIFFKSHIENIIQGFVRRFAVFRIAYRFKNSVLTACRGIRSKLHVFIRHNFIVNAYVMKPQTERIAGRKYLLPFLEETKYREDLRTRFVRGYDLCIVLQKRLRGRLAMKRAKLDLLVSYWDRKVFELTISAKKKKQKELYKIANSVLGLDRALLRAFLALYLK